MTKNVRMQKVVLGALATILVASLVLAVMAFVAPKPAAATYCEWQYRGYMCDYGTQQYFEYWCYHCYDHPDCDPPGSDCDLYCEWHEKSWPGQC